MGKMHLSSSVFVVGFLGLVSCALGESRDNLFSSEEIFSFLTTNKNTETVDWRNIQSLVIETYQKNKHDVIERSIHSFQKNAESSNITLVGSQNIYNKDGSLKEVRTIELSLPNLQSEVKEVDDDDDDDDDDEDIESINKVKRIIQVVSAIGFNMDVSYIEQDEPEDTQKLLYLSNDLLVLKDSSIMYVNKTIKLDTIDQIPSKSKSGGELTSILMYDTNSTFLKDKSTVVPELFASIDDDYQKPSSEIMQAALDSLVNVVLESKNIDDVPEKLQRRLGDLYPKTLFTITTDAPSSSYINKDYNIYLSYDYMGFGSPLKYSIFGNKLD